jgi:hypothetical protein
MSDPSRPATTTSSTSQVMKVDWDFPGSLDGETSVTLARPLPRKEPVLSTCPTPRNTRVTALPVTPEMTKVQGVWFSIGRRGGEPVELKVDGDTVTWPSGAEAKLVARHEQFCLTSATGKLFLSASVSEDENGELRLNWTDGSFWSRQPVKDASAEDVIRTIDSPSKSESFVSRAPKMLHKIQKTFGALKDRTKVDPGRKAVISDVQGRWIIASSSSSSGQVEVVVDGSKVSWSTGLEAKLVARNGQFMLTNQSGKIYLTGESPTRGSLCWTNGSVWKRSAELATEGKSSPAWTEFAEDLPEQE